jgi:hypothetical protein
MAILPPAAANDQGETGMKRIATLLFACAATAAFAATPAQEKQFVDTYKKAYEAKDDKTLLSMLYTKGADPQALEFYRMMTVAEAGGKISSIALVDLTAEDKARMAKMTSPDGKPMKLSLPPVKKLVIKSATKDKNGSSSSSSEMFVAEADGKLVIPVPAAAR